MKLFIFTILSFLLIVDDAIGYVYHDIIVSGLQLKPDEPLQVHEMMLVLAEATGSIGIKTLSSLNESLSLKIVRSKIDHIEEGALCSRPNIETLGFEDNEQFPVLTEDLLKNCDHLQDLFLKNVKISPGAFSHMPYLEWLEVKNQHFDLTEENLGSLQYLQTLEVRNCDIKRIDAGAICLSPYLTNIWLAGNTVISPIPKSTFKNCSNLPGIGIMIKNKNRVDVTEGTFTELANNVRDMTLENVNIGHLTKRHLTGLNNSGYIEFNNANISNVDSDAFSEFHYLADLHLENNHLNKITFDEDLTRMTNLHLDGNEFTEFSSEGITHLPNLSALVLINNKLTNINNIKHPKIKFLLVNGNSISKIDTKTLKKNLPSLKVLSLGGNPISAQHVEDLKAKLEGIKIDLT